jgi:anti-sigma factor RsiW
MVHEQAAAFALDALDAEESTEFERHLGSCPGCEDALEPLRFVAAALAFAGDLPAPPPALRLRVLEVGAAVIPLHRRWRGQLVAAGAVAAACLVLVALPQPWHDGEARATLLVGPSREAVLVVRHLPAPPAGRAYEAWIVDRGHIAPAGLLHGSMTTLTRPVPAGASVVVSVEPARGSSRPTGPVVLKAETA